MKLPLFFKKHAALWLVAVLILASWLWLTDKVVQGQTQAVDIQILSTAVDEQTDQVVLSTYFVARDGSGAPINNPRLSTAEIQLLGADGGIFPATISDPETPLYIALVLDASGSMRAVMPQVKTAAQNAIDQAPPNAFFTVIGFDETFNIEIEASNDRSLIKGAIDRITVADRGTCLYDTVDSALGIVERQAQNPGDRTAVILFTDGKDELVQGGGQPCSIRANLTSLINRATPSNPNGQPIPIHTIGLGTDPNNSNLNVGELRNLAESTKAFSAIGGTAELSNLFQRIMNGLNSQLVATAVVFPRAGENSAALNVQAEGNITLSDTFRFTVSRDYQEPLGAPRFNTSALRFIEASRQYELPISIANAPAVNTVVLEISRNNILVESIETPAADTLVISFPITNLVTNEDYLIQIKGIAPNGQLIEDDRGGVVLAELAFKHEVAPPPPPNFVIQSANVEHEADTLVITLNVPEIERIETYEAILIDEGSGAQVGVITTTPLTDTVIIISLPPEIQSGDGSRKYALTMELITTDGQSVIQTYSFQPPAAPTVGRLARIWQGLVAQPLILGLIVLIFVAVIGALVLRIILERRNKPEPIRPPVNDHSIVFEAISDPIIAPPQSPMGRGFSPPAEHDDDLFVDPLPSRIEGSEVQHVRLTFVKTPQAQPQEEVIIETFPFVIGREGGRADLKVIGDPRISREHLRLDRRGANLTMTDLGSGNGTFLADGQSCSPNRPVNLHGQQQIRLGPSTTIFLELM